VDTLERQDRWSIKRGWKEHIRDYPSDEDKCNTVLEKVTHLAKWENLLLQHLVVTDSTEDTTYQDLTDRTSYIATDGSAPAGKGSLCMGDKPQRGENLGTLPPGVWILHGLLSRRSLWSTVDHNFPPSTRDLLQTPPPAHYHLG
jgi:hypothetical protein